MLHFVQHFKYLGRPVTETVGTYAVLHRAHHADTKATHVVYQNIGTGLVWIRSEVDFEGLVDRDGYKGLRFNPVPFGFDWLRCLARWLWTRVKVAVQNPPTPPR